MLAHHGDEPRPTSNFFYLPQVATARASLLISAFLRRRKSCHHPPASAGRQQGCSYHDHRRLAHAGALERATASQIATAFCVPWLQRLAIRTLSSLLAATGASCLPDRDTTPPNVGGTDEPEKVWGHLLVSGDERSGPAPGAVRTTLAATRLSSSTTAGDDDQKLLEGERPARRPTPISTIATASASAALASTPTNHHRGGGRVLPR